MTFFVPMPVVWFVLYLIVGVVVATLCLIDNSEMRDVRTFLDIAFTWPWVAVLFVVCTVCMAVVWLFKLDE